MFCFIIVLKVSVEDKSEVREIVHQFLLELCCSRANGINFFDSSFGYDTTTRYSITVQFVKGLFPHPVRNL